MGGKFHLKLNIGSRPIANKYHEGKVKRTLKRELKVPEIAEREPNRTSPTWRRLMRAMVMSGCFSASVAVGLDPAVRVVSRLVCQRQLGVEDNC